MAKVNALTSALSNPQLLAAFKNMPEGDFILEIFASAIEKELEKMFDTNALANSGFTDLETRVKALNESKLVAVLEALLTNLSTTRPQVAQPQPTNYFENAPARVNNPLATF